MTYVLAFILSALGLMCIVASQRPGLRFDLHDYGGDSRIRFFDGAKASLLVICGVVSIVMAIVAATTPESFVGLIPLVLCVGAGILPISILSAYNRSFVQKKLFGGYQPFLRKALLNEETAVPKLSSEELRLPRSSVLIAGVIAVVAMGIVFYVLQFMISWKGDGWTHIAFSVGLALVLGFGVFMQIIGALTSRTIERARAKARERDGNSGQSAA